MYNFQVHDNSIPFEIHKAAYEYCYTRRWYAGYRNMPPLDYMPLEQPEVNPRPVPAHRSIIRAPFCSHHEHLQMHKPIEDLFNAMNEYVFDGKMVLDGLNETSPGIDYIGEGTVMSDVRLTNHVPFYDPEHPHSCGLWERAIYEQGAIAYMQAQPFESVRQTRIPHRDWKAGHLVTENPKKYSTVIFVANLEWRPEWFAEMTLYADALGDVPGAKFEDLKKNRRIGIGYPQEIIANKPGRILVQDGRQLHATRAVGETAPEPSMHINFRVSFKD